MAQTSLYRKYRPTKFSDMIGQQYILKTLKNSILSGNISHAYLFTGTRGSGKTTAARIFAHAINCLHPDKDGSPCGECEVCKLLNAPNALDIIEIDAASNNSVEDIRDLREKVKFPPVNGKYKVYIIDEVHMLSISAFNALLKTLEEPPSHAVFILATTEAHKIPATILSRCMKFDFRLYTTEELTKLLEKVFIDLKRPYQKEALQMIAEAGNGSVRDSLSLAEMCLSYCENDVKYEDVLEVLGASSPHNILELIGNIIAGNVSISLDLAHKIIAQGKSVSLLAKDIAKTLRNVIYAKNCPNANQVLGLPLDLYNKLIAYSNVCTNNKLVRIVDIFMSIEGEMRYSTSADIVLEMAIVKACDVTVSIDTNGIIQRLKEVEQTVRALAIAQNLEGDSIFNADISTIWGKLLNKLSTMKNLVMAYKVAASVKETQVRLEKDTLIIEASSKSQSVNLMSFISEYKQILCAEYFYITNIKVEFFDKEGIKANKISELKEFVGEDVIKIKNKEN